MTDVESICGCELVKKRKLRDPHRSLRAFFSRSTTQGAPAIRSKSIARLATPQRPLWISFERLADAGRLL